jgi:NAD(P)-dependent dehydrogenase (short-subunit alcohol dehydrogenase family)
VAIALNAHTADERCDVFVADVANPVQCQRMVDEAIAKLGRLDLLSTRRH